MNDVVTESEFALEQLNVRLVSKQDIWWMRLIARLRKIFIRNDTWMETFWMTLILGPMRIIGYPSRFTYAQALERSYTIDHELVHVHQADGALLGSVWLGNVWFLVKYVLLWFPVLGAYFRYNYEIEAYVAGYRAQIKGEGWIINPALVDQWVEWVVDGLWYSYFWTWPRFLIRRRLKRDLVDLYRAANAA